MSGKVVCFSTIAIPLLNQEIGRPYAGGTNGYSQQGRTSYAGRVISGYIEGEKLSLVSWNLVVNDQLG